MLIITICKSFNIKFSPFFSVEDNGSTMTIIDPVNSYKNIT